MKFLTLLTPALLPLTALASPLASPETATVMSDEEAYRLKTAHAAAARDAAAEAAGLFKRNKFCDIVNVVTEVDCWWLPKHGGSGNHKVKSIAGSRNDVEFSCYARCKNVGGITAWYWAINHGCYIPGYYTDNNCRSTGTGHLPKCAFADGDTSHGGCA